MSNSKPEGSNQAGSRQPGQGKGATGGEAPQGDGGFLGPKGDPSEGKRSVGTKPKA